MTQPPGPGRSESDLVPARVLVLQTGVTASPLVNALAAAGCQVETISGARDLAGKLRHATYDAVLADLTEGDPAHALPGDLGIDLRELLQGSGASLSRPLVLALSSSAHPPEGESFPADVWIVVQHEDQVLREVESAIAARRLWQAREEIEVLREAVLHARNTAHELAQPLTTILARSQLLLNSLKPDHPQYRSLTIICQEADRLARTVEEFQKLKAVTVSQSPQRD